MQNKVANDIVERLKEALSCSLSELADEKMEIKSNYEFIKYAKEDFEWCEIDRIQDFINGSLFELDSNFALGEEVSHE